MKKLKLIVALALVVVIAGGLWAWWHYGALHPSTEDAFLRAHIVNIAPQVPGEVTQVDVHENQQVKRGDVLFRIDPTQYRNKVDTARAQVKIAEDARKSTAAEISAAEQGVTSAQSTLDTASKQLERAQKLFTSGNISQATLDQDQSNVAKAKAALDSARSQLTKAHSDAQAKEDQLAAAQAQLNSAKVDLGHAVVRAPADGWVSNLDLRAGATVSAYQPLFALVESAHWWVQANFKETDLARIKPGQPVTITVDMLPGVTLKGHVESVGRGSGATFSLLPAENASGNWVKVTQRFPVRIALDKTDATLRTGASVTAKVDTTVKPDSNGTKAGQ